MRKYGKARNAALHHKITKVLKHFTNSTVIDYVLRQRAGIILSAVSGIIDQEIGILFTISRNVVARWRKRFIESLPVLNRIAQKSRKP